MSVREARPEERAGWDARTVDQPGGHVYQSRAWAEHRRASGWLPRFLVADDGGRALALTRRWPLIRGGSAYLPRGPVPMGADGATLGGRLVALADSLGGEGIDVVAADPEVPAVEGGFRAVIEAAGFHAIEEIQPARHRVSLPLGPGVDEPAAFDAVAKSTRQRIRAADRSTVVVRHDARLGPEGVGEGFVEPVRSGVEPSGPVDTGVGVSGPADAESTDAESADAESADAEAADAESADAESADAESADAADDALDRFYDLLLETGERRHFSFGPRAGFVAWWRSALRAGHLVYLEARAGDPAGEPLAGLILYRHGGRLSTVHSGDRAATRSEHPGALHLLRWRAIQLAIREGCMEMDLGGVDVAGSRGEPREGDPLYGLYQHKASFGGRWLELTGAHERIYDARGYAAGRLAGRVARSVRR